MAIDPRIDALLNRWEGLRSEGQEPSAEELCRDAPELLDTFKQALHRSQAGASGWDAPDVDQTVAPADASKTGDVARETQLDETPAGEKGADAEDLNAILTSLRGPGERRRLGPYHIVKLLGIGGMGLVFEAVDVQLGRSVALKTLRPELIHKASARTRFLREARAVAALEHEHVVSIYHVGEECGVPFLVMPRLQGQPLDSRLMEDVRFSVAELVRIGRELAEGLAAAHARGLVHRDIKPANIWLEGAKGRVKILDFGLARLDDDTDARLTRTGDVLGTPAYMAPEQAHGEPSDQRSDLFSLGAVLYRMATGRAPFQGRSATAVLASLVHDDPDPPGRLNPELPRELDRLIVRLLSKDPAARPASARLVADALRAIATSADHGGAEPPKRWRRPVLRNALLAAGAVTAAGVAFGPRLVRLTTGRGVSPVKTFPSQVPAGDGREAGSAKALAPEVNLPSFGSASDLTPGRADESFPGLVPLPAVLPGLFRWQLALRPAETGRAEPGTRRDTIGIRALAFSPEGRRIASAWDGDRSVRLWNVNGTPGPVLETKVGAARTVSFSRDGRTLAINSGADVRLCDATDGTSQQLLHGHGDAVLAVEFSRDGKLIASGSADRTVRIWDPAAGLARFVLEGHQGPVLSVAISPNGRKVASGGDDRTVRTWDARRGTREQVFEGHADGVNALAFHPDEKQLASASSDGMVRLWDLETGALRVVFDAKVPALAVAISPDGHRLASRFPGGVVRIWDLTGQTLGQTLQGQGGDVTTLNFSPDGRFLASGHRDGTIWIRDATRGTPLRVIVPLAAGRSATISAAGQLCASGGGAEDEFVYVFQTTQDGPIESLTPTAFRTRFAATFPTP